MSKILTLAVADKLATSAIQMALSKQFAPITVVVLDAAGHTIVSKRMDGCSPVGYTQFAHAKANTALITKGTSRAFRDKYTKEGIPAKYCQMMAMVNITEGKMAPFPGGVIVKSKEGLVLGAVGVSGASGDEDEECAASGIPSALEAGDI